MTLARKAGAEDFLTQARTLGGGAPLPFAGEPVAQIGEGALCLNDPAQAQACLAVFDHPLLIAAHPPPATANRRIGGVEVAG